MPIPWIGFEGAAAVAAAARSPLKKPRRGREGKETGRKEIRLVEGIQAVPQGGGKDPWTEGAVSLGVINITDLCNLTHFRSPSATTTRSIFLPFLLLKPVHPSHPLLLPSFVLPSSLRSRPSNSVPSYSLPSPLCPPRVQATKIPLPAGPEGGGRAHAFSPHLSVYGKEDFYSNTAGRKRDAVFNFQPAESFLRVLCKVL